MSKKTLQTYTHMENSIILSKIKIYIYVYLIYEKTIRIFTENVKKYLQKNGDRIIYPRN